MSWSLYWVYCACVIYAWLWAMFAVRMQMKVGYRKDCRRLLLVWILNFLFTPVCMVIAIIKAPIGHSKKSGATPSRRDFEEQIKKDIRDIGCIYKSIGDAFYQEPFDRLSQRIAHSVDDMITAKTAKEDD